MEDTRHNVRYPTQGIGHRGPGKGILSQHRDSGYVVLFSFKNNSGFYSFPVQFGPEG